MFPLSLLPGLSRISIVIIAITLAGLAFWRGMAVIDSIVDSARLERDRVWKAEIAKANAETEVRLEQMRAAAAQSNANALAEIDRLSAQNSELEKANAALPNGNALGIDAAHARLLK